MLESDHVGQYAQRQRGLVRNRLLTVWPVFRTRNPGESPQGLFHLPSLDNARARRRRSDATATLAF
jgi:hypothetical protein